MREVESKLPKVGPGRPALFLSAAHFEFECRRYFASRSDQLVTVREWCHGEWVEREVKRDLPVSVLHLCLFLGISRTSFYRYLEAGHEFREVAQWAQDVCEGDLQLRVFNPEQVKGAQFLLNTCYDYAEKRKVELGGGISDEAFLAAGVV